MKPVSIRSFLQVMMVILVTKSSGGVEYQELDQMMADFGFSPLQSIDEAHGRMSSETSDAYADFSISGREYVNRKKGGLAAIADMHFDKNSSYGVGDLEEFPYELFFEFFERHAPELAGHLDDLFQFHLDHHVFRVDNQVDYLKIQFENDQFFPGRIFVIDKGEEDFRFLFVLFSNVEATQQELKKLEDELLAAAKGS